MTAVLHIFFGLEEFITAIVALRLAGYQFVGPRPNGAAHSDQVRLFFSELEQGLPRWVVINIERVGIGWVNLESTYLIEIYGGSVNRLTAQRSHQSFASGHHD